MNYDELAVVCEQLAGMLRAGMTLPEALRDLTPTLPRGRVRRELERVALDLARGEPMPDIVEESTLPSMLKAALSMCAAAGNLPETLDQTADHYRRHHELWERFRLVAIYGGGMLLAGVVFLSLGLSIVCLFRETLWQVAVDHIDGGYMPRLTIWVYRYSPWAMSISWGVAVFVAMLLVAPAWSQWIRERLIWLLPGVKELHLCMIASTMVLLLRNGYALRDALEFLLATSRHKAMEDIRLWRDWVAKGYVPIWEAATECKWFPPMFVQLVDSANGDWEAGFRRAAKVYAGRAAYKAEMWCLGLFPGGIWMVVMWVGATSLILGLVAIAFFIPLIELMNHLGG